MWDNAQENQVIISYLYKGTQPLTEYVDTTIDSILSDAITVNHDYQSDDKGFIDILEDVDKKRFEPELREILKNLDLSDESEEFIAELKSKLTEKNIEKFIQDETRLCLHNTIRWEGNILEFQYHYLDFWSDEYFRLYSISIPENYKTYIEDILDSAVYLERLVRVVNK